MAKTLSEIDIDEDDFLGWYTKTNYAINAISTECLTANTDANGALTVGNSALNGIFTANVIAVPTLRGGNVQSSGHINVSSNAKFSGAQVNVSANVYITGANIQFDGLLTTTSNVTLKSNSTFVVVSVTGNSTVKELVANADFTITGNVSISKNVSSINYLSSNVITGNTVGANALTANSITTANAFVGNSTLHVLNDYVLINTTGTSTQLLTSYSINYKLAKILISASDQNANAVLGSEILLINDGGTTVYSTEYAILASNGIISTFTANANSTVVRLYATPTVANTTIKLSRTLMK